MVGIGVTVGVADAGGVRVGVDVLDGAGGEVGVAEGDCATV